MWWSFVWFQDPAGIFELVEVVGNGTYGQVYKVGLGWFLQYLHWSLQDLRDCSITVLHEYKMNVKDEFSHGSPDGCDLLRMRMRTQCDKHDIDYKLALKQQNASVSLSS